MAYIVLITVGRGKERAIMQSTPLPTKEDVVRWVKRNPLGNLKTEVRVKNTITKRIITGSKAKFSISRINW